MPFVFPGVVRIPEKNTFLEGAMLEPVNTVLKAILRLELLPGDTALVIGQGPIGLMFTQLLAMKKVNVAASDLMPARLKLARQFGARWTFSGDLAASTKPLTRLTRRGIDAAILAVPADAVIPIAQNVVRGGGKILLFAHTRRGSASALDLASICVDEKDVIGSYSADVTLQNEVARLVFSRRCDVRKLVTHRFPLERTAEAVALAAQPRPDALKIVIDVPGGRVSNPKTLRHSQGR
jgi:L-iditol 2-dehydrogenase